jgi:hypothetical protein
VYAGFAPLHQETARPDRALHLAAPIKPPERCPWSAQLTGTSRERPISRLSRAAEQGDEIPPHHGLPPLGQRPHLTTPLRVSCVVHHGKNRLPMSAPGQNPKSSKRANVVRNSSRSGHSSSSPIVNQPSPLRTTRVTPGNLTLEHRNWRTRAPRSPASCAGRGRTRNFGRGAVASLASCCYPLI